MEPSQGDEDEWFAPRANRRLFSASAGPSGENKPYHTDSGGKTRSWLSEQQQQQQQQQQVHSNASFVPDTPIKNSYWRNDSPGSPPSLFDNHGNNSGHSMPGRDARDRLGTSEQFSAATGHASVSRPGSGRNEQFRQTAQVEPRATNEQFHGATTTDSMDRRRQFQGANRTNLGDTGQAGRPRNNQEFSPHSEDRSTISMHVTRSPSALSSASEKVTVSYHGYQQSSTGSSQNPQMNLVSISDPVTDETGEVSDVSNTSFEQEKNTFWKQETSSQKARSRNLSSSSSTHSTEPATKASIKAHRGFNIPAKSMLQDEAGYLNRSNTSLNKSQTSLRSDEANSSWNIPRSASVSTPEDAYRRGSASSGFGHSPSIVQHPDCNLSFSVQDVSPAFLVRRFSILFENNRLEECNVLVKRISDSTLSNIITELDVRNIIKGIPYSLGILHTLYVRLYEADDLESFPSKELLPSFLVSQFIEWLSVSDKAMYNRQHGPYAHNLPLIHDILQIIAHVEPENFHLVSRRRRDLEKCLRGLGNHGLVDTSDRNLVTLHDALKVKFSDMIQQLKAGIQKLDDSTLSHRTPVLRSLHRGKAPSGASHQRLMEISQSDIQQRLIKNKSLLNVVEPAIMNTYLDCLMNILEERIDSDKNVLFLFTELNKELPSGLQPNQMLAPMFQNLAHSYGKVLEILKQLPPCGRTCNYCDDQGLICDWESTPDVVPHEDLDRQGSTTSFGGGPGSGVPQHGHHPPLDRPPEKPQRSAPGTARVYPNANREHHSGPIGIPVTSANGTAHSQLPNSLPNNTGNILEERLEAESLRNEVSLLRKELGKSRDTVRKLQERETMLKDRLSEQAQKQIEKGSTKFEDLSLGDNRPTQLIRRYGNLYSETRLDAFDALEDLPEIAEFDDLKGKLLFSVIVLAFRAVQRSLLDTRNKVRHLLCMPQPDAKSSFAREPIVRELEDTISVYLRKFIDRYDVTKNVETPLHDLTEEVCGQVWSTLYDYPSLKECQGLRQYIEECVRLAWALSVQNPPLCIEYDSRVFHEDTHTRFHTSDSESDRIKSILWPSLREGDHGPCVFKGVVIT